MTIFEGWMSVLLAAVIMASLWQLIYSERQARKLIHLATVRSQQYVKLVDYCERKQNLPAPKGMFFYCKTSLLWISEGRWQEVCMQKIRPAQTYPKRWFMVKTECSLRFPLSSSGYDFSTIHWVEKS